MGFKDVCDGRDRVKRQKHTYSRQRRSVLDEWSLLGLKGIRWRERRLEVGS